MVLCFRELGRARTSSPQMSYMYVNDIYFFYRKLDGARTSLPLIFFYLHLNDVDIFITGNYPPHPKFLYIKMLFLIQKKKEKRFFALNFLLVITFWKK